MGRFKGLQPGSLSQKQIDLVEKPSSGGFVLQKEVISPGKRYEMSMGDPSRHLTACIDRDHEIVMSRTRRNLDLDGWHRVAVT